MREGVEEGPGDAPADLVDVRVPNPGEPAADVAAEHHLGAVPAGFHGGDVAVDAVQDQREGLRGGLVPHGHADAAPAPRLGLFRALPRHRLAPGHLGREGNVRSAPRRHLGSSPSRRTFFFFALASPLGASSWGPLTWPGGAEPGSGAGSGRALGFFFFALGFFLPPVGPLPAFPAAGGAEVEAGRPSIPEVAMAKAEGLAGWLWKKENDCDGGRGGRL